MRARAPLAAGALVGLVGLVLLGLTLGTSVATLVVLAVLGLVVGAALCQCLAWLRTIAGSSSRQESRLSALQGKVDGNSKRIDQVVKKYADDRVAQQSQAKDQLAATQSATQALRVRVEELFKRQSTERRQVRGLVNQQVKQQSALLACFTQLQRLVPLPLPMPRPGAWAASEDYLLWLVGDVLERRPAVVVDLGSGQSSVWMAGAMRAAGYDGLVLAIDHDADYAAATQDLGHRQGVGSWLRVVHAPLAEQVVDGRTVQWYDPAAFADVSGIGLLSVDGPPAADAPQARWPALPVLHDRMAPGARVVLDDMVREDEQEIAREWCERYPGLQRTDLDYEKGAVVLTLT